MGGWDRRSVEIAHGLLTTLMEDFDRAVTRAGGCPVWIDLAVERTLRKGDVKELVDLVRRVEALPAAPSRPSLTPEEEAAVIAQWKEDRAQWEADYPETSRDKVKA